MRRSSAVRPGSSALLAAALLLGLAPAASLQAASLGTTTSVDAVGPVAEGSSAGVTAHVSPADPEILGGSVSFDLDGTEAVAGVALDGSGVAHASVGPLAFGDHAVVARFVPADPATVDPSTSDPVTVHALHGATISWTHAPSPRSDGDPTWFNVTLDTTAVPIGASLSIRDVTTDTEIGSVAVTGTHTFLSPPFVVLALGSHTIRTEMSGDPTFVPASLETTIEVVPDTVVQADVWALNLTTFYPLADGYRNRLRIAGGCAEWSGCSPKAEVFTASGQIVRRWVFPALSRNGYKVMWDGRTAGGTLLKAGKYRIHHVIRDWKDNVATFDQWVTLSHRTVRWIGVSVTRIGRAFTSATRLGTGRISTSRSTFAGGVRISSGASGEASLTYALKLRSGIARRSLRISILAYGTTSKSRAIVFWADDPPSKIIGPGYTWWRFGGTQSSVRSDGTVHPEVIDIGPGWFDIGRVRITYQYAVWAPYP